MLERTAKQSIQAVQRRLAKNYFGKDDPSLVAESFHLNNTPRHVITNTNLPEGFESSREILLNREIQKAVWFLRYINLFPRKHQKGGSLRIGNQGRVTSTTDTYNGTERKAKPHEPAVLNEYEMAKAHSDFVLHDDDIAAMSDFDDWTDQYRAAFLEAMGNDRVLIGWHGETAERTSDKTKNPLLQDVNKGWITLLKERMPENLLQGGKNKGEIKIGPASGGGEYPNLDALVHDLYQGIPLHKRTAGMTALISESIMGAAEGVYYEHQGNTPSEKEYIKRKTITGMYGGLDSMAAPFMPQTSIIITPLSRNGQKRSNLSIYWQRNSWKRFLRYKPELESSFDWNARREAYHIEDLRAMVGLDVQKIIFVDKDGKTTHTIDRIPEHQWED